MTVISIDTDYDTRTVTVVSVFDAPIEQVWGLWADPRKLERWWGPPSCPATFTRHHLVPGGDVRYVMTSLNGEQHPGLWRVAAIDMPVRLRFDDFHTDANGEPLADHPVMRVSVELVESDSGTRMVIRSTFESREDFDRWLGAGTREGLEQAITQMDTLLRP